MATRCRCLQWQSSWKLDLESWHNHLWPVKSGPAQLQRRLIAIGDKLHSPSRRCSLSEVDAKTGKVLRSFEGTEGLEEVVYNEGSLYVVTGESAKAQEGYEPPMWKFGAQLVRR